MIETQYTDIFKQYRHKIDEKSAPAINSLRDKAFEAFGKQGFPTKKLEDYLYLDVAAEFLPDFALNLNRVPFHGNPYVAFRCEIPNLTTNLYFVLNDLFHKEHQPRVEYPKGVFVGSLKDFAEQQPETFAKYYGQVADVDNNGIVAFNTMFVQDGFVIYVPKGVIVEKPIQLINILKSEFNYLVNRRIMIIAEDDAQVKLLVCDHTVDESQFLATQVTEIFAGRNAIIDYYDLEENSDKVTRLTNTFVHQQENSNVLVNNMTLNTGVSRNNYNVKLDGEHAEAYVCGMVIADRHQYVDNFAFLDHLVPHCTSTQLFKYVLQDDARGSFCGRIRVEKDAQKTMAYQSNNNLCISPTAHMYSKPQLEIYADDVKCSHGLTTGQLDEEALFYLRSRGIGEDAARLMLMQAFAAGVLEHVRIDVLKVRLLDLVEKRFKGETARCGNCAVCK
ncbi:Fe-S cluster assembly protein SufD [Dysgonomonas sp. PFB1-18]|uniref:Fe-S cluster assembly protein SufD n=1 Tax=unclassified Dysgonomonas TaxID=2630389 RepID=UPI0024755114|nr:MULTISPECIES: Fe-S cluster assembly protein SufD [unclassified Dysgonomonas]MDH6308828.1 Fe-S cluster assembly protein SufD [Dysgonomonas sp. PF1-14]MDH6338476.1 Fe-S cluster assembly protein SufD [Dysgonomonas sp. PF1-16]MDH6380077.1 Fe-S cluster assembly protein SufD [Dysgonomonas sp. PFB1-18]MDH6397304.1 Fe-S cluster assembly protein SufD [Dysgonomonas sp. PF1-23]